VGQQKIASAAHLLRSSVTDPGSGIFLPLDLESGIGKKSESGSWIVDEQPGSYLREQITFFWVKILKFFEGDLGFGINIPDSDQR